MFGLVREMGRKAATAESQTRRTRAAYMAVRQWGLKEISRLSRIAAEVAERG